VTHHIVGESQVESLLAPVVLLAGGFHLGFDKAVEGEEELCGGSLAVALDEFANGGWLDVVRFCRGAHC